MQKVAVFQHAEGEWIGSMEDWFSDKNFQLETYRIDLNETLPEIEQFDWLILMGGPMSVNDEQLYPWLIAEKQLIRHAIDADKIVLGICLGGQLIASAMGATIYRNQHQEIGWYPVSKIDDNATWMPDELTPLSWHGDCFELPENAIPFAASELTPYQGFCLGKRVWALQFHLEAQAGTVEAFLHVEQGVPEGKFVMTKQALLDDRYLAQSRFAIFGLLDWITR